MSPLTKSGSDWSVAFFTQVEAHKIAFERAVQNEAGMDKLLAEVDQRKPRRPRNASH